MIDFTPTPPTPIGFAPNPFDPAATATAVFKTLDDTKAAIPDGHTHAIIIKGDETATGGPSGSFTFIQGGKDSWNTLLDVDYDKDHGFGAGFMIARSW